MSGEENYRRLFEGSQASLSDMAARQAQALSRVGRLRSAISNVLRKNFTELSAQAEANLGTRLSETDDEILLAYLDAFTAAASRADQRTTLQALGEAIRALGIPLRGEEPLVWVEQIHQYRNKRSVQQPPTQQHATAQQAGSAAAVQRELAGDTASQEVGLPALFADVTGDSEERGKVAVVREGAALMPVEDYWKWDDGDNAGAVLGDLFADAYSEVSEPERWESDLGGVEPEERWTPSPIQPGSRRQPEVSKESRVPAESEIRKETGDGPRPESSSSKTKERGAAPAAAPEPGEKPQTKTGSRGVVAGGDGGKRKTQRSEPAAANPGTETPSDETQAPGAELVKPDVGGREHIVETNPETVTPEPSQPASVESPVQTDGVQDGPVGARSGSGDSIGAGMLGQPLRPQLFTEPVGKRKKTTRTIRTQASGPGDAGLPLGEFGERRELDDAMRQALLAAASIPRPVFARDLVAVTGSLELVDEWEAECRANLSTSPVRFVAPKSRHRLRGCLVAVDQTEVRASDWWNQAVKRYRAGRLYELAVLLHRVGDEVVSFSLDPEVAAFRLNTPRGLIGVVVLLDTKLSADGPSVADMVVHLEQMLSERLTMVAVLTTSAEPGSLESVADAVERAARENAWVPTAPVVAARSWEYADDRGTSAVMVLGE
jgi:hypothetical protein